MIPALVIAKKEFLEHTRRGGVVALATLFALVTLFAGFLFVETLKEASAGFYESNLAGMIQFMQASVGFLIPIIVMLIGHAAIAGEAESGSLALLLAQPVSRLDVVVGKFLGLAGVAVLAEIAGFGAAGAYIATKSPGFDWGSYALFVLATILFACAYLGLFLLFSAFTRRRSGALTLSIASWVLFGMVWDFFVAYLAIKGGLTVQGAQAVVLPAWFTVAMAVSPPDLFVWFLKGALDVSTTVLVTVVTQTNAEGAELLKNAWFTGALLIAWVVATVAGAWQVLERKDV